MATANTVLSVLAADYLAAGFARRWVPFCRRRAVEPRAPELYFARSVDYLRDRAAPSFVKERRAMKVIDHSSLIGPQKRLTPGDRE